MNARDYSTDMALGALNAEDSLRDLDSYFDERLPEECERYAEALVARSLVLRHDFGMALVTMNHLRLYFDNRSDADGDSEGYRPNAEMRALVSLDRAIEQVKRLALAQEGAAR